MSLHEAEGSDGLYDMLMDEETLEAEVSGDRAVRRAREGRGAWIARP